MIRNFSLKSLRGYVRNRAAKLAAQNSGLFSDYYYLRQLPNDHERKAVAHDPFEHFWKEGGFQGLDPGPEFDSSWYLQVYPDVLTTGLNPLGHYVRYGIHEGRSPAHGAKPALRLQSVSNSTLASARSNVWRGFDQLATLVLKKLVEQGNGDAALVLADWYFVQGEVDTSVKWFRLAERGSDALLHRKARAAGKLRALGWDVDDQVASAACEEDERFIEINRQASFGKRLRMLSELYAENGLMGIELAAGEPDDFRLIRPQGATCVAQDLRQPMISVLIPAFNAEKTLSVAVESLLAQSWQALEIIIIDDASDDDTYALASRYAEQDSRVIVGRNPRNTGAYGARNHALSLATGDFIIVHDSDDWSHPEKLERQLRPMLSERCLMGTYSYSMRVDQEGRFLGHWRLSGPFLEISPTSWLVRREAFERCGEWDSVRVGADTEFVDRMIHHYGFGAFDKVFPKLPLTLALADSASLTRSGASHIQTQFYGLRRLYKESYQWWHRHSGKKPVMAGSQEFPLPLGNMLDPRQDVDLVVVANWAQPEDIFQDVFREIGETLERGTRVALFHWPDYSSWHGNVISDSVFEFCHRKKLFFVHHGVEVAASQVMFVDDSLWRYPPSRVVKLPALSEVVNVSGENSRYEDELIAYFAKGGTDDA